MHSVNCYFPLCQFAILRLEVVRQLDFCIRSYSTIQNTICLLSETGPLITKFYHMFGRQICNQKVIRVDINALYWFTGLTDGSGFVQILSHAYHRDLLVILGSF